MYVRVYRYLFLWLILCVYACVHLYVCIKVICFIFVCERLCMCVCTCVCLCMRMFVFFVCTFVCMYAYVYVGFATMLRRNLFEPLSSYCSQKTQIYTQHIYSLKTYKYSHVHTHTKDYFLWKKYVCTYGACVCVFFWMCLKCKWNYWNYWIVIECKFESIV